MNARINIESDGKRISRRAINMPAADDQSELIKKLLAKLPDLESQRGE